MDLHATAILEWAPRWRRPDPVRIILRLKPQNIALHVTESVVQPATNTPLQASCCHYQKC